VLRGLISKAQHRQKLTQREDRAGHIFRPESRFPSRCRNKGLAWLAIGRWSGPDGCLFAPLQHRPTPAQQPLRVQR
jgi:hypothetical protein